MAERGRILVIEDDADGLRAVTEAIAEAGWEVVGLAAARAAIERARGEVFDAVITDLVMPEMDGLAVLRELTRLQPDLPVLLMTAHGSIDTAVRALKDGAYDYLVKPLNLDDLQARIARAVETRRLRAEVSDLHRELRRRYTARAMQAGAPVMQAVLRQIEAVASTMATVLILGESGTGKELVARALHVDGRRAAGPFVAVNCGAFAESLLESELFGHEKGAFTGAAQRHPGAFERAQGGTLFLDEIGIAPPAVQARLLRVLEEHEVLPVGGTQPLKVDARIVAASNRDLEALVAAGEFRHDLLYRLQVVTLRLPPLRERREDLRPLADRFLAQASAEHGRRIEGLAPDAYARLEQYDWPGNVRELRNAIESAVILASGPLLTAADFPLRNSAGGKTHAPPGLPAPGLTLAAVEKEAILQALRRHEGNRALAAGELGISPRTIQRKVQEYQLPF